MNPLFCSIQGRKRVLKGILGRTRGEQTPINADIIDCGKEVSNLERRMAELAAGDTAGRRTDHTRSTAAPER